MAILVTRSSMPSFEEYCAEIRPLWESCWLTNNGEKVQTLQRMLCERMGAKQVSLFANGHFALEAILRSMKLTGEVITTPFTFASTTHAIVRVGLTPVFCDIEPNHYTMDVQKIEALITEKTTAILPVHVYGHLCDVDGIEAIAKKHNLKVIYDAAHAFDVYRGEESSATFGDASMYSFHATKVFQTIEGGAVASDSLPLHEALALERNFGIRDPEDVPAVGGNAKMNEFQAAMGICNLRHLSDEIGKRKEIYECYLTHLQDVKGIVLPTLQAGVTYNYAYLPVLFGNKRDLVFDYLEKHAIHARKYFYPLITDYECYQEMAGLSDTPVAKKIASEVLTLPLYADLTKEDVSQICERIIEALSI